MSDVDTTIIGAGPYGLSIAAHLSARSIPFELLGTALSSWRRFMPRAMVLKSERFASNLWDPHRRYTLRRYCKERGLHYQPVGDPLSLTLFLEYADWFRQHTALEPRDVKVVQLRRVRAGFDVQLADGTGFTSRRVVLATGHMAFRVVPEELAALPEPLAMHSACIGEVQRYTGRDVTIIGAGQSALETAAILHENGARVRVLVRRERIEWNGQSKPRSILARIRQPDAAVASGWKSVALSELPRVFRWYLPPARRHRILARAFGPSGAWWLRQRLENRAELLLNCRVVSARAAQSGQGVLLRVRDLNGEREIRTDHLIAATGFRVDLDRLEYLEPSLNRNIAREVDGIAALDASFETSVPGLFIVGVASAPVFGPIMRFMYGAKHVAPILARRLRA